MIIVTNELVLKFCNDWKNPKNKRRTQVKKNKLLSIGLNLDILSKSKAEEVKKQINKNGNQ